MNWLPYPEAFRARLAAATELPDDRKMVEFAALASLQLSYLEITKLDHKVSQLPKQPYAGLEHLRLAILASSSVRHLLPCIRVAGLRHSLHIQTLVAGYDQQTQEVLDPSSSLHEFRPDAVLFAPVAHHFIRSGSLHAHADEVSARLTSATQSARQLWTAVRRDLGALVVQQSYLDLSDAYFGNLDASLPATPRRFIQQLNEALAMSAHADGVLWLDTARAAARFGVDDWYNPSLWFQGKIETSYEAAPTYGELVARLLGAARGKSKKCLVLDLDNTLWGGVLGEVGPNAILLGEGSAIGEAHLALQAYACALRDRGVLLAICSKNDPALVDTVLDTHPEMLLRRSDFAAVAVNWTDKAENLIALARLLNIGLDSLVFLDDHPAERARIRQALPMVAVPEPPPDPSLYVRCLSDAGYFEAIAFTPEDKARADYVARDIDRAQAQLSAGSLADYLAQLDMHLTVEPVASSNLTRVTQLINKTNQFNTTTIRRSEDDIRALATNPRALCLQFRLSDRFGDNGGVSAMLLAPVSDRDDTLELNTWVMSCRVFGRKVEHEALNALVEAARERGILTLRARFIPTDRNGVIADLFPSLGFSRVIQSDTQDGQLWELVLENYEPHLTTIQRKAAE